MPIVDVNRLKNSGERFVKGFTTGQKVVSILGVAGLVLGVMMFSQWSSTPDYAPLYTGLSAKDTGEITKSLDSLGVQYRLADGGTTVEVPRSVLYKTRADMAGKGLPASSDSFALFDRSSITESNFTQNIKYQRALQGELTNTILAMNGIHGASVNLALPSNDPFAGDSKKTATAAVQVDTGGVALSDTQVQSIVHLVSASVKDLSPEGVTVADTAGHLLYSADASSSITSSQNLARQTAIEQRICTGIDAMVARTLGPGHAACQAQATVDFASGVTESETHRPVVDANGKQLPSAQSTKGETLTEPASGTNSNVIGGTNPAAGTATSGTRNYKTTDNQTQFIVDTEKTTTQKAPDTVTNLSVSVALDQGVVKAADLPMWTQLISAAAGIQTTRNDRLVVRTTAMDKNIQKQTIAAYTASTTPAGAASSLDIMGIARYALTLLVVGLVLFLAWRSIKKAQAALPPTRVELDLAALEAAQTRIRIAPAAPANELVAAAAAAQLPAGATAAASAAAALPPAEPSSLTVVGGEVSDLIERQPDEVAQTLRSWLADRRA